MINFQSLANTYEYIECNCPTVSRDVYLSWNRFNFAQIEQSDFLISTVCEY